MHRLSEPKGPTIRYVAHGRKDGQSFWLTTNKLRGEINIVLCDFYHQRFSSFAYRSSLELVQEKYCGFYHQYQHKYDRMGSSKSKLRKLSPKTLEELQRNVDVDFTREEIEEWYMEYQATLVSVYNRFVVNVSTTWHLQTHARIHEHVHL